MKVRFWGVRGSIPVPGPHTARYGGNTTCIEVRGDDGTLVILDAGTGIFPLAQRLLRELPVTANIFITHTHWDHIQGLPFFTPIYIPGNALVIHGPFNLITQSGPEQVMDVQMQYSFFPIREAELRAVMDYVTLMVGEPVAVGSLTVTPVMLNHPVTNYGYRVDGDGRSMFFTGDHEPWVNIYSPEDAEHAEFQQMIDQQQAALDAHLGGLDLLVADSSYTEAEYRAGKVGWGHGTMEGHVAWARRLGVGRLACTHHEPTRSDEELEKVFSAALGATGHVAGAAGEPDVFLAREGLEIDL